MNDQTINDDLQIKKLTLVKVTNYRFIFLYVFLGILGFCIAQTLEWGDKSWLTFGLVIVYFPLYILALLLIALIDLFKFRYVNTHKLKSFFPVLVLLLMLIIANFIIGDKIPIHGC